MQHDQASLRLGDESYTLPVRVGTEGEQAIDVSQLRKTTGLVTYDPSYANTGSVASSVTYIDGEKGILRYRGYPVEDLAGQASFLEVAYLLIYGELPGSDALDDFGENITRHTLLREDMRPFFDAFPPDAHPMAILASATSALSTFYQDAYDPSDEEHVEASIFRLIAKLPTVAAFSYKRSIGQPYIYPRNDLSYPENFLHMMFAVPAEPYVLDPAIVEAINLLFIVHADHEQNCSASTVRMVGSSHLNLFGSIAAGVIALWGPKHGGASQTAVENLLTIQASGQGVQHFIARAKDSDDPFLLPGFGHRVYKNYDPRARIIKRVADDLIGSLVGDDPLFALAQELEQSALEDEFFVERNLYPNVDFYSGLVYRAIGIPLKMFPVMFSLARLPGWIAQWREMMRDPDTRINRPRQIYTGPGERVYLPVHER